MKNLSPFQIILLSVSAIIIIIGVLMFAFSRTESTRESGLVVIWGTLSDAAFTQVSGFLRDTKKIKQTIEYRYIPPDEFDEVFTTALAEGNGPDLVMITDDKLVRHEDKLFQIGYEYYNDRLFKDTFVEAGELFKDEDGIYAFPFVIDPMVMYWNRTSFTQNGVSQAPRYWDELLTLVPRLVEKNQQNVIQKAAVAMGEYQNISHAKELLLTLFMQAGNKISYKNTLADKQADINSDVPDYVVIFSDQLGYAVAPAQAAVNFYTQFANPTRSVYSWNRALDTDQDAFIAGDTAMYFGFASEFATIRQKNPNLNFDVAVVPQSRTGDQTTYGRVLALAIPKNSSNIERAYALIMNMIQPDTVGIVAQSLFLPPVRRDLLAQGASNAFMQTFHDSALLAKNIYDFDPEELDDIFKNMIESVTSGRLGTSEAINRADSEIELLAP